MPTSLRSDSDKPPETPVSDYAPRDMDRRQRIRMGVTFRRFHVLGSNSSTSRQHTAISYVSAISSYLARLFGFHEQTKPTILRDFSGSVWSGEMLLVLGRPGSGCSTFLKTLAGETRGLEIDDVSKINYDGAFSELFIGAYIELILSQEYPIQRCTMSSKATACISQSLMYIFQS
jgi:ABC-type glutathione transport system ATPase component